MKPVVVVTGGNGHLGYHLVGELARAGYRVRATVRDLDDPVRTRHLQALREQSLSVELARADLLDPESLAHAIEGADAVFHSAAPNIVWDRDPENTIVRPIVEGTEGVLRAAIEKGVSRVIFTSSCSAMGIRATREAPLTEERWNDDASSDLIRAKIVAERRAWKLIEGRALRLVSICVPSMVGPGFYRHTPVTRMYQRIWQRKTVLLPRIGCHLADVRDVAMAHRLAYETPGAQGRYAVAGEYLETRELFRLVKSLVPGARLPELSVPDWSLPLAAGLDWLRHRMSGAPRETTLPMVRDFAGMRQHVSCERARRELGFRARPARETLRDLFEWLAKDIAVD